MYTVVESSFSLRTGEEKEDPKNQVLYVAAFDDVKMHKMTDVRQQKRHYRRLIGVTLYGVLAL